VLDEVIFFNDPDSSIETSIADIDPVIWNSSYLRELVDNSFFFVCSSFFIYNSSPYITLELINF